MLNVENMDPVWNDLPEALLASTPKPSYSVDYLQQSYEKSLPQIQRASIISSANDAIASRIKQNNVYPLGALISRNAFA